jgi:hypothetical protein
MTEIQRVIFTGDILRPFPDFKGGWESATYKNIRWIRKLLGWQIERATGLPQSNVVWEPGGFDAPRVYDALDLPINYESWASLFYAEDLSERVEDLLAEPFEGSIVIGVELPDFLQCVLARRGIPFIDTVGHPVRFMDDILFGMRTNHGTAHQALLDVRFDVDRCVPYANLHRAKAAWMPSLDLPDGTALITGQVSTDKAVICRKTGRHLSLKDYIDRLFEICENHPLVLFKPHPYQGPDCPSRRVIGSFRSIRVVTDNFYYLMGQDAITDVYAISSGTVHEAPFFGKRGHAFAGPLYTFGERPPESGRAGEIVPVQDEFLSPRFWSRALRGVVSTEDQVPEGPSPRSSRLRRSLNADWDYGFIDAMVVPSGKVAPRAEESPAKC